MSDFNFYLVSKDVIDIPYSDDTFIKYSGFAYYASSDSVFTEKHYLSFILKDSDTCYCIGKMYKLDLSAILSDL